MSLSQKLLHRSFRTGIALKGLDGLLEGIAGVILLSNPAIITNIAVRLWCAEIMHDPTPLAPHIERATEKLANVSPHFATAYLLGHAVAKIVLVIALWMGEMWAYPLAVLTFGAFLVWEAHRFTQTHSVGLIFVMIFDFAIIVLIWMEYRAQRQTRRDNGAK